MAKQAIPHTGVLVLKQRVLATINTTQNRIRIAASMGVGEEAIRKYIQRNDPKLTQAAPLLAIKKIMGCLEIDELLEPQKATA